MSVTPGWQSCCREGSLFDRDDAFGGSADALPPSREGIFSFGRCPTQEFSRDAQVRALLSSLRGRSRWRRVVELHQFPRLAEDLLYGAQLEVAKVGKGEFRPPFAPGGHRRLLRRTALVRSQRLADHVIERYETTGFIVHLSWGLLSRQSSRTSNSQA